MNVSVRKKKRKKIRWEEGRERTTIVQGFGDSAIMCWLLSSMPTTNRNNINQKSKKYENELFFVFIHAPMAKTLPPFNSYGLQPEC